MNEQKPSFPDSGFDQALDKISLEREESSGSKELVSFEESLKIAHDLLEKYGDAMKSQYGQDIDGWEGLVFKDYQKSIGHYIETMPDDVLKHFSAHGITRYSIEDRLAGALNILANKAIKGECGSLERNRGQFGAYTSGDFLVVSKPDKPLPMTEEKDGRQQSVFNEVGWMAEIGAFIVDTKYYPMVNELRRMFPDVNIIKANQLPEYLKS